MTYPALWEGIRSWVLRKREATYSTDVRNDPRTAAAALEVLAQDQSLARSIAVAPLMVKEEIIGTLTLANEADKPALDQEDLDLLIMLASQAAIALERINWLEGQQKHTKNLENLHTASLQLASIRALRPVLETILAQLNQFIAADFADIFLYKDGALTFGAARTKQGPADHPSHPVGAHDLSQTVALKGNRIIVSDASSHPLHADHPWEGAEAGIPLSIGDRVRGVLYIRFGQPHTFTGNELLMLEMFAEQAAIALENAQRVEALEVGLKALSARSQISSTLQEAADTQEISQAVAREAARLVQADSVNIYLFDEEQQYLIAFGSIGQPGPQSLPVREALAGASMEDLPLPHTSETLPFNWAILEGTGSGICHPLRTTGGQMIGVLLAGWEPEKGPAIPDPEGEADLLLGTIAEVAANALKAAQSQQDLEGAYLQSVLALAKALDARNSPTGDHNQRLARLAESIAQALDCSDHELMTIRWAGLLHDIGKIRVPDKILNKPGPLTDAEWMILKRHPEIGAEIVSSVKKLAAAAPIIRAHQEKFDGTGYPLGLTGQDIPRGARIMMIANAYTAMTSERVYRKARSHREAISELKRCSGSQFDPELVEVFLQVIEGGGHPAASISQG
jgi:putative nucleotidyltransferase with HDIG domain